jgi:short-subunit dehydrogenase
MTEGLPVPPFACDPEAVAAPVLRAIDRGTPVVYVPTIWALVMLVIRQLPRFVMRRIDF